VSDVARGGLVAGDRGDESARPRGHDLATLPDRREFWLWVWSAVRPVVGWVLAALGALALFLGWYGVSGESLTSKQLPYLVSGGLTGIALVIVASVFLATEDVRRQLSRVDDLHRKVDDLYALFVEDLSAPPAAASEGPRDGPRDRRRKTTGAATDPAEVVALPAGSSYHRPDCALVTGKPEAAVVNARAARARGLRPCRVCDPPVAG
jgi:hypothetical protein